MKLALLRLWWTVSGWCLHQWWMLMVRPSLVCPRCGCCEPDPQWPNCWHCDWCGYEWCVWSEVEKERKRR